ncbi:hypothetical protein [uncultured Rubinisphaera sp.]|uniref:hypothetical protein n=1 Tax=uncultured Rubinisphaera sp. TaxID=1678686 RepID=UPI0030DBD2A8
MLHLQQVSRNKKESTFNQITSHRLSYPDYCTLANTNSAASVFEASQVDCLSHFTIPMWDILMDVFANKWFGLRLPPSKIPWEGPVAVPAGYRLLYCLNQKYARQARTDIRNRYLNIDRSEDSLSIFAAYGLQIQDDTIREREGLQFIARQSDHFSSQDDYIFIIQDLC